MAWVDPSDVDRGNLIKATVWNQDAVDNYQLLHDRTTIYMITGMTNDNLNAQLGINKQRLDNGVGSQTFFFSVPSDYGSFGSVRWYYSPATTGFWDVDFKFQSGALGEAVNNNSTGFSSTPASKTQDQLYVRSFSEIEIGTIAAGDIVCVGITHGGGGIAPNIFDHGLSFAYIRS